MPGCYPFPCFRAVGNPYRLRPAPGWLPSSNGFYAIGGMRVIAGGGAEGVLSGQGDGAVAFGPFPASTSWADRQLALLRSQYEGRWDIWYVPVQPVGYHWCARPAGARTSTIAVGTPEDLVAEIRRQEESPVRGRDFSDLSASELERVHRDLAISAALAVPSSGAYLMTVTQMQAIDAELGARRRTAGSQEAS